MVLIGGILDRLIRWENYALQNQGWEYNCTSNSFVTFVFDNGVDWWNIGPVDKMGKLPFTEIGQGI